MRAHNGEHSDALPVLDVSAMKHIAYVFDALIYYMRAGNEVVASASASATPDDAKSAASFAEAVDVDEATNDSEQPQPMDLDDSITYDNEASNQSRADTEAGSQQPPTPQQVEKR